MSSTHQRHADLRPGDEYPPGGHVFEVTEAVIARFRAAATRDAGADTGEFAPALLAAAYTRGCIAALKGPPGGVHAKQNFRFLQPVRAGDTLTSVLRIRETFQKKGRNYVVSTLTTTRTDGVQVSDGVVTAIWGKEA